MTADKAVRLGAVLTVCMTALSLAGCGTGHTSPLLQRYGTNNPSLFQRDQSHDPTVVFIGDDVTYYWAQSGDAFTANPLWINKGVVGDTTGKMLARFQTDVIDLHPDAVHIMGGVNDVINPDWAFGDTGSPPDIDTPGNLIEMVTMAQAVGIKVIVGDLTPWGPGALSTQEDSANNSPYGNTATVNDWLTLQGAPEELPAGLPVIGYHTPLAQVGTPETGEAGEYVPSLTDNGVDPNMAGYGIMTPLAEAAIASLKVGGLK